jgi:hypothetical protein
VGQADGAFNHYNTLIRSSALDRTIMTARSFLDAVFPSINQPTNTSYLPDGQQASSSGRAWLGVGRGRSHRAGSACPTPVLPTFEKCPTSVARMQDRWLPSLLCRF